MSEIGSGGVSRYGETGRSKRGECKWGRWDGLLSVAVKYLIISNKISIFYMNVVPMFLKIVTIAGGFVLSAVQQCGEI